MQRYGESRGDERGGGAIPTFLFHSRNWIRFVSSGDRKGEESRGCQW